MKSEGKSSYGPWRPQRYFTIRKPISNTIGLQISAGLLNQRFGVNMKTIRNGVSKFLQQQSKLWHSYRDQDAVIIDYDSIPTNTKIRAKLPIDAEKALEMLRGEMAIQEDLHRETEINHLRLTFEEAYQNHWPSCLKFYTVRIKDEFKRVLFAKSHALIEVILKAVQVKWPSKVIFSVYGSVLKNQLDSLEEMRFKTHSPTYFWRVIRNCRLSGIPETLMHDSLGVSREYKIKMTGAIRASIRLLLRSRKLTIRQIINTVKSKFEIDLSPATIKRLKAKAEDRNVLEYDANGKIYSRQNGLPKITRFLAEAPGEQYQGDFYKLQFYCRSAIGKVIRLWAYIVLDVFSKKVVGWALGEEQSATLAKNAFKMAFVDHCFLPEEIIIDNDVFYKRPVFKRLMRRLNNLGVITTKAFPNIPTWKAEIESFFAVFQKLHSSKPWYIGEDIQSKNLAGNPPKELVKEMYTKVSSMMSVPEMITEFGKMIQEYNHATNDRKKKVAPADMFRMYESKRTIKLETWMEPLLFWKTMTKKRIKDDGRIDLQIDGVEYRYQVTKAEIFWKHKNSDVRMCYNPEDLSKVHIFERGTLTYIGVIEPRMVMTRDNKKEIKKAQRRVLYENQQFIKDKRKEDEDVANGIVGTSVRKESIADKIIKRQLKRRKFEREVQEVELQD